MKAKRAVSVDWGVPLLREGIVLRATMEEV